jgi:hypothetical protein
LGYLRLFIPPLVKVAYRHKAGVRRYLMSCWFILTADISEALSSTLNLSTMNHLQIEINLNASKGKVWQTLIDVNNYENWNPFIVSSEGEAVLGKPLTNKMMNNGSATVFTPIATKLEQFQEFEWLGSGLLGMFKGRHYFILEDLGNGQTKLIHGEKFSGLLSGLILKLIGEDTLQKSR